jgi:hypothetical protein
MAVVKATVWSIEDTLKQVGALIVGLDQQEALSILINVPGDK